MTTSYVKDMQRKLKQAKYIARAAEKIAADTAAVEKEAKRLASMARIEEKLARIEGRILATPELQPPAQAQVESTETVTSTKTPPKKKAKAKKAPAKRK